MVGDVQLSDQQIRDLYARVIKDHNNITVEVAHNVMESIFNKKIPIKRFTVLSYLILKQHGLTQYTEKHFITMYKVINAGGIENVFTALFEIFKTAEYNISKEEILKMKSLIKSLQNEAAQSQITKSSYNDSEFHSLMQELVGQSVLLW